MNDNKKNIKFIAGLELDKWMQVEIAEFLGDLPSSVIECASKLRIDIFLAGIDYDQENIKYIILLN